MIPEGRATRWWRRAGMALVSAMLVSAGSSAWTAETNRFGFAGPEIFPIDNLITQLRAADLDGDGLQDLVVVNNARSAQPASSILYSTRPLARFVRVLDKFQRTGSPTEAGTLLDPTRMLM